MVSEEFRQKNIILDKYKSKLKKFPTDSEIRMVNLFKQIGIRSMFQKGFIAGKNFCIADFYIPSKGLVIEVDGGYHSSEEQQKRDRNKDFYYSQRKVNVLRLSDSIAMKITVSEILSLIDECRRKSRDKPHIVKIVY